MSNTHQPASQPVKVHAWTITGADDQTIYGNTHVPAGQPRGVVLIAHGLKSYKDYGFQPALAHHLASLGFIAHRFNFSHSGMTNDISTFARTDLFEKDTWQKQVADVKAVAAAVSRGALPGTTAGNELPQIWLGHSRGGNTTVLAAGQAFEQDWQVKPAAIVALASGDSCCRLTDEQKQFMHEDGYLEMLSSRTGQVLRQGEAWLSEQEADPDAHDLHKAILAIRCPALLVHGQQDDTVPHDDSASLQKTAEHAAASQARSAGTESSAGKVTFISMSDTNHTFNAPNPLPLDAPVPEQTQAMFEHVSNFIQGVV